MGGMREIGTSGSTGGPRLEALARAGEDLFLGRGPEQNPEAGIALLAQAAEGGHAAAAARLAVLAAAGVARPQSWSEALDLLLRAAELGDEGARGQLSVLAGAAERGGPLRPAEARARVDVQAWLTAPAAVVESEAPRIITARGVASAAACKWLRTRAKARLARARVNDAAEGERREHGMRTNSAAYFGLFDTDLVLLLVQMRLAALSKVPWSRFEPPNVLHYAVGETFKTHVDFINPAAPAFAQELALFGQRIATALVWLNDGYAGGQTDFPTLGKRFRGAVGDALVFFNVDELGQPEPRTLHAGMPPTRGQKWILSQWMRERVQPIA
jgi:hypothetical protein